MNGSAMNSSPLASATSQAAASAGASPALSPLVAILGPTASGKSALAVALARRFGGEVVACDSTQVYRGFDIGTGKPTAAERAGIAHHLIDVVDISGLSGPSGSDEPFNAGEYRRQALRVLAGLGTRGTLPIFTVGTGLYWRALTEGLADAPQRSEALRERLNDLAARRSSAYLHRVLQRFDGEAAARIAPADRQKLVRALEVRLLAGKPLSQVHREGRQQLEGYAILKIGLEPARPELRARIETRVNAMIKRGWGEEVRRLVANDAARQAKPLEFIGYRELRDQLLRGTPLPESVAAIVQATRQYAKRQLTWFRKEPGVRWFAGPGDSPEIQAAVSAFVEDGLATLRSTHNTAEALADSAHKSVRSDAGTR